MRRLFKLLFFVALVAAIAALVTTAKAKKRQFAGMTDDEIRDYIDAKLGERVPAEKLDQIKEAAVRGVAGMRGEVVAAAEDAEEAAEEAVEAAEEAVEAAEEAVEAAEDAEETVIEMEES